MIAMFKQLFISTKKVEDSLPFLVVNLLCILNCFISPEWRMLFVFNNENDVR